MSFQTRTLTIAIWVLIIVLSILAAVCYRKKNGLLMGNCPHYWQVLADALRK